ncbi:MAG: nickel-dependent hydrogenase large subunit [Candidatus Methanomethylicia archaeon]
MGENNSKETSLKIGGLNSSQFIVPIGPFHPALLEGEFFKLKVDGEKIISADIKLGYNYRGIMKLAEERDYWKNIYLFERICGICNFTHTLAYVMTVEMIGGIDIPDRARYIRTFLAELERIHSHMLWAGIAVELLGFKTLFMYIWREREHALDIFEMITGNRRHSAMNTIGGVRRDISIDLINRIEGKIKVLGKKVKEIEKMILEDPILKSRTKGIGVLGKDNAKKLGVVGPVARANGLKVDIRKMDPYAAYKDVPFDIITRDDGDVYSLIEVRIGELYESIGICLYCLDVLKRIGGPIKVDVSELPPGEAIGRTEAPRGELFYYILSNGTNIPERVRIRTPSYMNDYAILHMLPGYTLADAPIIIASVDPCMTCTDRCIYVEDVRIGIVKKTTLMDLSREVCGGSI